MIDTLSPRFTKQVQFHKDKGRVVVGLQHIYSGEETTEKAAVFKRPTDAQLWALHFKEYQLKYYAKRKELVRSEDRTKDDFINWLMKEKGMSWDEAESEANEYFAKKDSAFTKVDGQTYFQLDDGRMVNIKDPNDVIKYDESSIGEMNILEHLGVIPWGTKEYIASRPVPVYAAKKENSFQIGEGEKMRWLDGAMDGKVSEEDYIGGNLKRTQEGGWPAFKKSVVEQTKHPMKDLDEDWTRYTAIANNDVYGPAGKSEPLSTDRVQRAEQRAAADVAKIITQANVEPLIDHGKNSTARDLTVDLVFGRTE
jgi:hypothetical protein